MPGRTQPLVVPRRPMPGAAGGRMAIFDLDRTLVPISSLVPLVRALAAAGLVDRRQLMRAGLEHAVFRRRGSTDGQVERVRVKALALVAGLEREQVLVVAERVAAELTRLVSPGARLLLRNHLDAGDFCLLLSASPQELVERVGRALVFHRAVGTRAELVNGRYTGDLDGPLCYGEGKLDALVTAIGEADLGAAFAYADSASDLPLLQACGQPVAVNPDRALRRVAHAAGWPILSVS